MEQNERKIATDQQVIPITNMKLSNSKKSSNVVNSPLFEDVHLGMQSSRAIVFVVIWYIFSAFTLFLNKYILQIGGDAIILSTMQMVLTMIGGFIQLYFPCGMYRLVTTPRNYPKNFKRNMIIVGCLRFSTVFWGLVALKYVAVSFTETVKSSAPIFTVLIAYFISKDNTGFYTVLSLLPIMSGLALCSANELSFNIQGFCAALVTNISECIQNVFSKQLISGEDKFQYTPAEMQYYTSIASIGAQIITAILLIDVSKLYSTSLPLLMLYIINGVCFHYQTISAYGLMQYASPVTHSVINTVKRAFLIWSSVLIFQNSVTLLSGLGTVVVTIGVFLYNKATAFDKHTHSKLPLSISTKSSTI